MHLDFNSIKVSLVLRFILAKCILFFLILLSFDAKAQSKPIHAFSINYSNNIYFPEKVVRKSGPLYFKPFAKYSYDIELNYSLITKMGLGFEIGIAQGFIPFGYFPNSNEVFNDDFVSPNGAVGNPIVNIKSNQLDVFYFDFPIKLSYSLHLNPKILVNVKAGMSFKMYPDYVSKSFWYRNNENVPFSPNQIEVAYLYSDTKQEFRNFFPDLLVGVDFLIQPKKPNHFLKLGVKCNYGFVERFQGEYFYKNLGNQYNSHGQIFYGSSYVGISLGYQFMKYNAWKLSNAGKKMLFNPRF